jgi:hypothetical protein
LLWLSGKEDGATSTSSSPREPHPRPPASSKEDGNARIRGNPEVADAARFFPLPGCFPSWAAPGSARDGRHPPSSRSASSSSSSLLAESRRCISARERTCHPRPHARQLQQHQRYVLPLYRHWIPCIGLVGHSTTLDQAGGSRFLRQQTELGAVCFVLKLIVLHFGCCC